MKDHEAFLRFIEADVAQSFGFFPRQVLAAENLFRERAKLLIIAGNCNPKREHGKRNPTHIFKSQTFYNDITCGHESAL